jgi:NADPH:quinone reductase-like Zn-dependent oxidoreductase
VVKKTLKDKTVLVAAQNALLIYAVLQKNPGIKVAFLSSVFATGAKFAQGELVSIVDHINVSGLSPLSGATFQSSTGLYKQVAGLPAAKSFFQYALGLIQGATLKAALSLGCDVLTSLGPQQAVLVKAAGGGPVIHVGFVVHQFAPWLIPEEKIYQLIFE